MNDSYLEPQPGYAAATRGERDRCRRRSRLRRLRPDRAARDPRAEVGGARRISFDVSGTRPSVSRPLPARVRDRRRLHPPDASITSHGRGGEFFGPLIAFLWFFGVIDAVRQAKAINRGQLAEGGWAGDQAMKKATPEPAG